MQVEFWNSKVVTVYGGVEWGLTEPHESHLDPPQNKQRNFVIITLKVLP